ncbi:MAG: MFS transporter [Lachnospiraceae bacterium]|nr:MFS transporter [Lachnospiraceae bacterium]
MAFYMKEKLTKQEKSWILYDVANSAFTMIVTVTIPIYFSGLTSSAGISAEHSSSIWGVSTSIAILILALLAPILGTIADYQNMKKKIFTFFLVLAITGAVVFTLAPNWIVFLAFFIIARLGYSACNIFYDAMLIDVTTDERMDHISTSGYAWGYIGSCIPFIIGILLILVKPFGLDTITATRISFVITILWWIAMSIPLFKNVHQTYYIERKNHIIKDAFSRLGKTFGKMKQNKKLLFFMLGYFCYIDGVYTIISMATTYGNEVGVGDTSMILALLLTQFVAFPCSILTGKLATKFGPLKLIKFFILIYCMICIFAFGLDTETEFWILAVAVGMCQGGIQALSRSHFGKLIPKEESSEYFGFFDIFGKFADFFGPLIIAVCAFFLNSSRYGVLALIVLFIVGLVFVLLSEKATKMEEK